MDTPATSKKGQRARLPYHAPSGRGQGKGVATSGCEVVVVVVVEVQTLVPLGIWGTAPSSSMKKAGGAKQGRDGEHQEARSPNNFTPSNNEPADGDDHFAPLLLTAPP